MDGSDTAIAWLNHYGPSLITQVERLQAEFLTPQGWGIKCMRVGGLSNWSPKGGDANVRVRKMLVPSNDLREGRNIRKFNDYLAIREDLAIGRQAEVVEILFDGELGGARGF